MARSNLEQYLSVANLSDEQAAYLAGLIDADGTVTVIYNTGARKNGAAPLPRPMVLIVNSDLSLIRWLRELTEVGCSYETKTRPKRPDQDAAHWNCVHRYQVVGRAAQALLARCRKYMRVKAKQADIVLALPAKGRDFKMAASDDQRQRAILMAGQIRLLNQRGIK